MSDYTFTLATQQRDAGDLPQAELLCRQVLAANPRHFEAWRLLGKIFHTLGRFDEAITCFMQTVHLVPLDSDAYNSIGAAQIACGRLDDAARTLQEALQCDPNNLDAANTLGIVFARQGQAAAAVVCFQHAITLQPSNAALHSNLGNVQAALGQLEEAAASHRQSLSLNPNSPDTHNNLGSVFLDLDKVDEALGCFKESLRLNPDFAEAQNNIGTVYCRRGQIEEAASCYQRALRLKPGYAEAYSNQGGILCQQGLYEEGMANYEQALRCDPNLADAHLNRALAWLVQGDWEKGWVEYEWRWRTKNFPRLVFSQPRWDGSPLPGRTLLVISEQGLGDTLQFVRYLALARQRVGRLILKCDPVLHGLLNHVAGIDQILANDAPLCAYDAYVPLLSLPGIFHTSPATIPAPIPYLQADANLVTQWQDVIVPASAAGPRVRQIGIAWQGNPKYRHDDKRSIPLAHFGRVAKLTGVRLISLQKVRGTEQIRAVAGQFSVADVESRLGNNLESFMQVASLVNNLDLVITCDSAIAHLAGALGATVWVALAFDPDWRWLLKREDTPWYPKMRLFRQTRLGQWDDVFDRMAAELARMG